MKDSIKNLKSSIVHQRLQSIYKTMLSYCLRCEKKKIESKNPRVAKSYKGKLRLLSKCEVCDNKYQYLLKINKIVGYK